MGLFSEFDGVTPETWLAKIIEDLKGADFEREVVWNSPEGIRVEPFYHRVKVEHQVSGPLFRTAKSWQIIGRVSVNDLRSANEEALHLLRNDYQSICFDMNGAALNDATYRELVRDILLDVAPVQFINYRGVPDLSVDSMHSFHGCFLRDFITDDFRFDFKDLISFKSRWSNWASSSELYIDAVPYKNAGSGIVNELAYTLALLQEYMHVCTPEGIIRSVRINMATSGNFFFELAKYRAIRKLFPLVISKYTDVPVKLHIQGEAASIHMTVQDPYNNLLRSTTAAMAAILGGVDGLYLSPYTDDPSKQEAGQRWARNISLLLQHEAALDQVIDPAHGSHYIETLTEQLCEAAWQSFIQLENEGGFLNASKNGLIKRQIDSDLELKRNAVANGKQAVVGVNAYTSDSDLDDLQEEVKSNDNLKPVHLAEPFEKLIRRSQSIKSVNSDIFLIGGGRPAIAAARIQFTSDFLQAAGLNSKSFDGEMDGTDADQWAAKLARAKLVVLCGDDDARNELLKQLTELSVPIYIAGHPKAIKDEKLSKLPNGYLYKGCNMIETLTNIQDLVFGDH